MSRKLYALFILIWALWSLVLAYLYFFVYYTAVVTVNANVSEYSVELFSKSTAQKWTHECPEKICVIHDVSPFEYNISISKQGYETELINAKISPRRREEIFVQLDKKSLLSSLEAVQIEETPKEKIKRLREEKLYFARFVLEDDTMITFSEGKNQLLMQHRSSSFVHDISDFPFVPADSIFAEYIGDTKDIFMQLWNKYYIFETASGKLHTLPFEIKLLYIKAGKTSSQYIIVTEKGSFLYNINSEESEFQYLFKDFVYHDNALIWIIYEDEEQKKSNFNLTGKWNLIIRYTSEDKQRKILLKSSLDIDRIEWKGEKIIFSAKWKEYELTNF